MKKLEFFISAEKEAQVKEICDKEGYTKAEFGRRAVEYYLNVVKAQGNNGLSGFVEKEIK